ncbi:MAG: transglycosylase domain-containing protein [Thermoanaerobaculia bacterium]
MDRKPVRLAEVSPALVAAVLAAEDSRFYEHDGIDWAAVTEARVYNRLPPESDADEETRAGFEPALESPR